MSWSAWLGRRARPLVIGHRGVRGDGLPTENSLEAFARAADDGADGIELDVRLTASDEVVVMHDPTLERTAGDPRPVAALDRDDLARVRLAGGERAPRLEEALALAASRGLLVNVEIKRDVPSRPALVRAAARAIRAFGARHLVLVSSFDPVMLGAFGALAPGVPLGLLLHRDGWLHRVARAPATALGWGAVHLERTLASPDRVRAWQRVGRAVHVWTVNAAREAEDLAAIGVRAIITDAPGALRAALEASTSRSRRSAS